MEDFKQAMLVMTLFYCGVSYVYVYLLCEQQNKKINWKFLMAPIFPIIFLVQYVYEELTVNESDHEYKFDRILFFWNEEIYDRSREEYEQLSEADKILFKKWFADNYFNIDYIIFMNFINNNVIPEK